MTSALAGLRVLDMSGPLGNYCGKLFGDLGADVILIEPPGGTQLRSEPPFIHDRADIESSLAFAYANTSKRSLTLDLEDQGDRATFLRLATTADLVIETFSPGTLGSLGLDYTALMSTNKRLVLTSITPFGQTGPYAQYQADDLVGLAMGGLLYLGGYPDTPPITTYGNQAYAAANLCGAVASMIAVLAAEQTGTGEHVDVSMQEAVVMALETAAQFYDLEGAIKKRWGGKQRHAGTGVFPCKDGYIYFMAGGVGGNRFWRLSCDWFEEEGVPGSAQFRDERWFTHEFLSTDEAKTIFHDVFVPYAANFTMEELYRKGQDKHVPIAPVSTPADLLKNPQLQHREFFVEMKHFLLPESFLAPGAPYALSRTPWRMSRPAPRLGEHNAEILEELGMASQPRPTRRAVGATR
ncbi:CaiB/BaiF CoA transferase family protein [Microvirga antarctica]|uniref:CaiB/BaiF CoA transferase family protein n=1 Tax=Microvirga antarctica TaxID=2819233 RepID=UPI001B318295